MFVYFKEVYDNLGIFIFIYNVLLCMKVDVSVEIMVCFVEFFCVIGVKDVIVDMMCVFDYCVLIGKDFI